MQTCGICGERRTEAKKFCTRCGARFSDTDVLPGAGPVPLKAGRRLYRLLAFGVAGAALLAGIGVGAWLLAGHLGSQPRADRQPGSLVTSSKSADYVRTANSPGPSGPASSSSAAESPAPSPVQPSRGSATPSPSGVSIAASAEQTPGVPQIAAFLARYFAAINEHDYQAYVGLRSPQLPPITVSQFASGYGSTTDSDEVLVGVSSGANGDSVAHVTFTSRQEAAASATNSSCTAWNVSLYLVPDSGNYLIGSPPASYRAVSTVCQQ
jgi:hypothetical protein